MSEPRRIQHKDNLAELIVEHRPTFDGLEGYGCACEAELSGRDDDEAWESYGAHLASVIRAAVGAETNVGRMRSYDGRPLREA